MNFPVPWRCLLPAEAVDYVVYNNSAVLRELSDRTGAMIDVSGDRDTPKRLSDRILTMSGQAEQKEGACLGIVERLRRLRDLHDPEEVGFFVIIVPAAAVPVVVGAKGVTIQEVLATSGADLSIGKENIMGMPDTPIGLEGTAKQVVAATAAIHRVIQEMADRGRLMPSDFKYRPEKAAQQLASGAGLGMPQVALPPQGHDPYGGLDPTQNFRTKAKIVIDTMTAGWLIGKGGRTIREMQENSGAFLHVLREEEAALVLPRPGDRLLEVCGRYERKLEGIQVVLRTADSMPSGQAPKETLMMIPSPLAEPGLLQEVADECGCVVEGDSRVGVEEAMITIAGPITNRIQAAQAFLTRLDKAHMDGTVVALSIEGEYIGKDGRPRKELRDAGVDWTPAERPTPAASRPPQTPAPGPTPPQGASPPPRPSPPPPAATPSARAAPAPPVRPQEAAHREELQRPPPRPQPASEAARPAPEPKLPERREAAERPPLREQARTAGSAEEEFLHARPLPSQPQQPQQPQQQPPQQQPPQQQPLPQQPPQQPQQQQPQQPQQQPPPQQQQQPPQPEQRRPSGWELPEERPQEAGPCAGAMRQDLEECAWKLARGQGSLLAGPALAEGQAAEALLVRSALRATAPARLELVLPEALLQRVLVPGGHLKDVANRCQVTIGLGEELPPALRRVTLAGTVAGNAAAAYWLQLGAARAEGCGG